MENEKKEEVKISGGEVDKEVMQEVVKKNVLSALDDEKSIKRIIFNAFAELLSEMKGLNKNVEDFNSLITIIGADKIKDYFGTLKDNIKKESDFQKMEEKIEQSHKKSCKKIK